MGTAALAPPTRCRDSRPLQQPQPFRDPAAVPLPTPALAAILYVATFPPGLQHRPPQAAAKALLGQIPIHRWETWRKRLTEPAETSRFKNRGVWVRNRSECHAHHLLLEFPECYETSPDQGRLKATVQLPAYEQRPFIYWGRHTAWYLYS